MEVLERAAWLIAFDGDDAALATRSLGEGLEVRVRVRAEAGEEDGGGGGAIERGDERGGEIAGDGEAIDAGGSGSASGRGRERESGSGSGSERESERESGRRGWVGFRFAAAGDEGQRGDQHGDQQGEERAGSGGAHEWGTRSTYVWTQKRIPE